MNPSLPTFADLKPFVDSLYYIVVPYHKVVGLLVVEKVMVRSTGGNMVYLECVVPVHAEKAVPGFVKKVLDAYPGQKLATKAFKLPKDDYAALLPTEKPPTRVSTSEEELKNFMTDPKSVREIMSWKLS